MLSPPELSRLAAMLGGLPVLGCLTSSSAAEAGIRYGDVLLAVDGKPTRSWEEFLEARRGCRGGFRARIFREGAELEIYLALSGNGTRSPLEVLAEVSLMNGVSLPATD
jgi:S1-C subfamily serine protease